MDEKEIRTIAELARLEFTNQEIRQLQTEIKGILQYVELLNEAPVHGVEPLMHPFEPVHYYRKDALETQSQEHLDEMSRKVLACAPEVLQDCYKVPPIF